MSSKKKQDFDATTLLASTTETATDNNQATPVKLASLANGFVFVLDVTAAATEAGDLLDVFVQTKADGTNFVDVVHFTQVLGNGGAKRFYAKINADVVMTEFENATALGAAAVRDIIGDEWAIRWAITDVATTGNASFTFSVIACPM